MAIEIVGRDITVEFPIYESSNRSLKKTVLQLTTGGKIAHDARNLTVVGALDGVNVDIREGDRIGLFGHNGSGKTTLLRVLSGVYEPVKGEISVRGRIASLLDVSMGLDPEATGLENIYLRGVLDGLKAKEIKGKVDEIAEFSELGQYLDLPVRTYSSGMMLRLAFAISTSVDADILLMDEWMSVGDAAFNEKASKRLDVLINKAKILVLATHNPALISKICNRKITLEHGRVVEDCYL